MTSLGKMFEIMYITNLGFKWSFLFDINFWQIQTDIIVQQTQRNNNKPPAEPITINKISASIVLVSLFDFKFGLPLAGTPVMLFGQK